MLQIHKRNGVVPLLNNCVVMQKNGGSLKRADPVSHSVPNNPIFGLSTAPAVKVNEGNVLGGHLNVKFNGKKRSNIRFII